MDFKRATSKSYFVIEVDQAAESKLFPEMRTAEAYSHYGHRCAWISGQ